MPETCRQRRTVEGADVIETKEPALENIVALGVFTIDPPGEIDQEFVKDALEEFVVARTVDFKHPEGGPGMYRRVGVIERPFVCGQLTVGMHVPLAQQQYQLPLGKGSVDVRQRHAMKGQVPCGKPRVLPLVGHGNYIDGSEVPPAGIAPLSPRLRRRWLCRITREPFIDIEMVELFRPE